MLCTVVGRGGKTRRALTLAKVLIELDKGHGGSFFLHPSKHHNRFSKEKKKKKARRESQAKPPFCFSFLFFLSFLGVDVHIISLDLYFSPSDRGLPEHQVL